MKLAVTDHDLPWLTLRQAIAAKTPRPRAVKRRWRRLDWKYWSALTFGSLWMAPSSRGERSLFEASIAKRLEALRQTRFPEISPEGLFLYHQRPVVAYPLYRKTLNQRVPRYHLTWCAALYREFFTNGNMLAVSRAWTGRFPLVCARRRGFAQWERRNERAVSGILNPCPDCLEYLTTVRPEKVGPSFTLIGYHASFRTALKPSSQQAHPSMKMCVWPTALGSRRERCEHCGAPTPPEYLQLAPRDLDRLNRTPENVIALCADCRLPLFEALPDEE